MVESMPLSEAMRRMWVWKVPGSWPFCCGGWRGLEAEEDVVVVRGRRRVTVGPLEEVQKVVLWRRRWPWRDLGSRYVC